MRVTSLRAIPAYEDRPGLVIVSHRCSGHIPSHHPPSCPIHDGQLWPHVTLGRNGQLHLHAHRLHHVRKRTLDGADVATGTENSVMQTDTAGASKLLQAMPNLVDHKF